jgi:hypothetical protein
LKQSELDSIAASKQLVDVVDELLVLASHLHSYLPSTPSETTDTSIRCRGEIAQEYHANDPWLLLQTIENYISISTS